MDNAGIVYILKNEAMPGIVKIGKTKDLKQRLRDLNVTSVPLPFECYFAKRVADMHFVEKRLFAAFSDKRVHPKRELFWALPERIKAALEIAPGDEVFVDERSVVESDEDIESLEKAKTRRPPFKFPMVGIKPGEKLIFFDTPDITCVVMDDKSVLFEEQIMSLTKSAGIVLSRRGLSDSIAGTDYWTYEGTSLWDLRNQAEESSNGY
jgi:hypothetical protein